MASSVTMKDARTGLVRKGYFGFSWTYLFFGWFVPLFRGELGIAALHLLFGLVTLGLWNIIMAFLYNKQFTTRLIEKGFRFTDDPVINQRAAAAVGVDLAIIDALPVTAPAAS